jgi:hypothetical protein
MVEVADLGKWEWWSEDVQASPGVGLFYCPSEIGLVHLLIEREGEGHITLWRELIERVTSLVICS